MSPSQVGDIQYSPFSPMLCRTLLITPCGGFVFQLAHQTTAYAERAKEGRGRARGDRCDWRNQIGIIWIDDDGEQTLTRHSRNKGPPICDVHADMGLGVGIQTSRGNGGILVDVEGDERSGV